MRSTGWRGAWMAAAVLGLAGCASEVGKSDPAPQPATESTETSTSALDHDRDACSPLACCFPTVGGGWQDDKLENRLRALGCSTPAPYQLTGSSLWEWTECPLDWAVIVTVIQYSGTPYDAHIVENHCLDPHPRKIDVVFDPTCPTCGSGPQD